MDNGSALKIQPHGVIETRLLAVAYAGLDRISGITPDGDALT
jgi:hypothetical protein